MTLQAAELPMADERKDLPFQIRCSESWLDRVKVAADRLGISAAAYIRMVASQRMDSDGIPRVKPPKKPH